MSDQSFRYAAVKKVDFAAQYPACLFPCSTLRVLPYGQPRMTRGQDGLLILSCTTLSFATLCRFIPAHQARPCPTFGRPVHLRGGPHRLRPGTSPHALRIPPHDGHPALRRPAGWWLQVRLGLFPAFAFVPLGIEHRARPALGGGFPFPLFRLQDGCTFPPWLTFPEAPL